MDDKTLYAQLLGLTPPWGVEGVELKLAEGAVHIRVALPPKERWVCPECLQRAPIHDHRERTWRHLDTFQYRTLLHAPRSSSRLPNAWDQTTHRSLGRRRFAFHRAVRGVGDRLAEAGLDLGRGEATATELG